MRDLLATIDLRSLAGCRVLVAKYGGAPGSDHRVQCVRVAFGGM
ncbi:hypothetical protein [Pantoea stewartii]|nr:hypothetical protein [Pantoea stewartii]